MSGFARLRRSNPWKKRVLGTSRLLPAPQSVSSPLSEQPPQRLESMPYGVGTNREYNNAFLGLSGDRAGEPGLGAVRAGNRLSRGPLGEHR